MMIPRLTTRACKCRSKFLKVSPSSTGRPLQVNVVDGASSAKEMLTSMCDHNRLVQHQLILNHDADPSSTSTAAFDTTYELCNRHGLEQSAVNRRAEHQCKDMLVTLAALGAADGDNMVRNIIS